MPRKLNSSPVALVERAVLAAVANARDKGWRQSQMEMFAQRLGDYRIAGYGIDLERECIRIVRTLGCRYARKLLNWFRAVKVLPAFQPAAINFPIGIPKASRFGEMKVQVASHVRISAIVDACFKLIVDDVSAPSWTRRDARKRGINVSQTSQCQRAMGRREAMAFDS